LTVDLSLSILTTVWNYSILLSHFFFFFVLSEDDHTVL
jgi:hypothetical protein